jgi:dUTP pyrophosphatase
MKIVKTDLAIQLEADYRDQFTFEPTIATEGSAGYDVRACVERNVIIQHGETVKIPLGFRMYIGSMQLPQVGLAGLILPRSGIGGLNGIVLGNLVGLVDSDYQEEWQALVWNRNLVAGVTVKPGMKIAQVIFVPIIHPVFEEVENFEETTTRTGGFNSTGSY